ncbi:Protein of unknown function [Pyronema omphalodes CBS 100304]|nr:Protein of unknown function [Pyronema omphalodes CBS 100304]
MEPNSQ